MTRAEFFAFIVIEFIFFYRDIPYHELHLLAQLAQASQAKQFFLV